MYFLNDFITKRVKSLNSRSKFNERDKNKIFKINYRNIAIY